jgi:hypothetical protein
VVRRDLRGQLHPDCRQRRVQLRHDEATRPEYEEAESTAKLTTNSADRATFTINATKTIYGMFLISTNVKGADGGVLFGAARFASSRAVIDNDVLLVSYSVSIA